MRAAAVVFAGPAGAVDRARALLHACKPLAGRAECEVWVLGRGGLSAEALQALPCARVLWVDDPALDALTGEAAAQAAGQLCLRQSPRLVAIQGGLAGDEAAVRLGLQLGSGAVAGAVEFRRDGEDIFISRMAYSMNLNVWFRAAGDPVVASMLPAPPPQDEKQETGARVETVRLALEPAQGWLTDIEDEPRAEEDSIRTAKLVVAAGRGMGSRENVEALYPLAALLGGRVGGTRPTVYDGWVPIENMIGASSSILSPEKCIVFGASGAAAFAAGIEKSGMLAAVNSDPEAAIFRICDVGVVGDCTQAAQMLTQIIREEGGA